MLCEVGVGVEYLFIGHGANLTVRLIDYIECRYPTRRVANPNGGGNCFGIFHGVTENDWRCAGRLEAPHAWQGGRLVKFVKLQEASPVGSDVSGVTHWNTQDVRSVAQHLNYFEGARLLTEAEKEWLGKFGEAAAAEQDSLFSRYRLLDVLLRQLNGLKAATEESLSARSPLRRYEDVEKELKEKWEDELTAAIEAEYRRRRADLLVVLERWLRDVWLHTLALSGQAGGRGSMTGLLNFPDLSSARQVAQSLSPDEAIDNLRIIGGTQQLLHTNVQEALALEVGMLKLHLGAT